MTPEKWEKVGEIFNSASELDTAERDAYLHNVCADDPTLLLHAVRGKPIRDRQALTVIGQDLVAEPTVSGNLRHALDLLVTVRPVAVGMAVAEQLV